MRDLLIRDFWYRENENLFIVEDQIGQHIGESWFGRIENVLRIFFGWSLIIQEIFGFFRLAVKTS